MSSFLSSINKKKKTPEQLVVSIKDRIKQLRELNEEQGKEGKEEQKNQLSNDIAKYLDEIKIILYGDHETTNANSSTVTSPVPLEEEKIKEISHFIQIEGLMILLIQNMALISFESRKDTSLIYTNLMKKNVNGFAQHIFNHLFLIDELIHSSLNAEIALHCGVMLRESIRYTEILRYILLENHEQLLWPFIDSYLNLPNFDVASDSFNTFKDILCNSNTSSSTTVTQNKTITNDFFERHGEEFLKRFEVLLRSENYVTRRRSLKLLGELLLDRTHYTLMMRYISSTDNLKTIMNLLRHRSSHIQFE
jgi:calcium binding protein 39